MSGKNERPRIVLLSDVEPEEVRWLWRGYIPLGKLTILDGDPGTAKTTLTLDLAARVSCGTPMPLGGESDLDGPRGAVVMTSEDGLGDTIRPRLDAAGADVTRIASLQSIYTGEESERLPRLKDVDAIAEAIEAVDAALVVIDPLMGYMDGKTNTGSDAAVREALAPLYDIAESTGVAILGIRHLNKKADVSHAMYRGGGSIAFSGKARSVLMAGTDPDDRDGKRRVLASVKCNLMEQPPSLLYRSIEVDNGAVAIEWLRTSHHHANALLGAEAPRAPKREDAKDFLRSALAHGAVPASEIEKGATESGIATRTLRRAAEELPVKRSKSSFDGPWMWSLPEESIGESVLATLEDRRPQNPHGPEVSPKSANTAGPGHLGGAKAADVANPGHLGNTSSGKQDLGASQAEGVHCSPPKNISTGFLALAKKVFRVGGSDVQH